MVKPEAIYASNSDEWETPDTIYQSLDNEFHFTLDPCATYQNHKCEQYYTQSENGLLQNWGGKESFAILHTVKLRHGLKRRIVRPCKTTRLLYY